MANADTTQEAQQDQAPVIHVAPSPHISNTTLTTSWMMYDVLIALIPVFIMSFIFFRWNAVQQVTLCVLACMAAESLFTWMRGRRVTLHDGAAIVTGVILGFSLPWNAPWYISIIGSFIAIGMGKVVFGGLGYNIFNPAMVGRAFVMLSFPKETGAAAYVHTGDILKIVSQATPLTAAKLQADAIPSLWPLLIGSHNGSLGETSVIACLIGGLYLCFRRSASWEIPVGLFCSATLFGFGCEMIGMTQLTVLQQLTAGSIFFGAFFIATDPVTSPLTTSGKFYYGLGIGFFTILIRLFSGYPEGVMFAVLLLNAAVPLINQWTIPRPLGGIKTA